MLSHLAARMLTVRAARQTCPGCSSIDLLDSSPNAAQVAALRIGEDIVNGLHVVMVDDQPATRCA